MGLQAGEGGEQARTQRHSTNCRRPLLLLIRVRCAQCAHNFALYSVVLQPQPSSLSDPLLVFLMDHVNTRLLSTKHMSWAKGCWITRPGSTHALLSRGLDKAGGSGCSLPRLHALHAKGRCLRRRLPALMHAPRTQVSTIIQF